MSRRAKYLCGVPDGNCTGGILHTDQQFRTKKCHTTRGEAFRCAARHLLSQGYERVGMREFSLDNGPIRVLPKRSKFGGRLRTGKEGTRYEPERGPGLVVP